MNNRVKKKHHRTVQQIGSILDNKCWSTGLIIVPAQTMVALHYLLKGFTMVTGHGEDRKENFLLLLNNYMCALLWCVCMKQQKSLKHEITHWLINPILFILNLDASMSPYNTFSIYIWPWGTVQRYVIVVHTYVARKCTQRKLIHATLPQ